MGGDRQATRDRAGSSGRASRIDLRQVAAVLGGVVLLGAGIAPPARAQTPPAAAAPLDPAAPRSACPPPLASPALAGIAERVAGKLAGQVAGFTVPTAMTLVARDLNAYARLELPGAEYAASRDGLARLDRATVAACWPGLGAVLAGARESTPAAAARPGPSLGMQGYEAQRAEMAERHRANAEARRARDVDLQARSEATDARVAARAEEERQHRAALAAREREEQARALIRQQQARADQERERQADIAAAQVRADALRAEAARQREVADREAAVERARQAERIREQQETLAKAQAEAQARGAAEAQSHQLAQKIDRLEAEKRAAAQVAERARRPECREADRVAGEETDRLQKDGIAIPDIAVKLAAGMRVEACATARRAFTAVERMRAAAARCEPLEAVPLNDLATGLRDLILEQGC